MKDGLPNPDPRPRRLVYGPVRGSLSVRLKTVTPVLGGASVARALDRRDAIRVPSIRGHLRFWWRAIHAHTFTTPKALAARERELWGGVGKDAGTRSRVELRVEVESKPLSEYEDSSEISPRSPEAYALWVAQSPRASRWRPGVCFRLQLHAPVEGLPEVERALRAWVLWGGYGSRTRRGLGSLTVVEEREQWLPRQPSRGEWSRLFPGCPLFAAGSSGDARPVPSLCGARLLFGLSNREAERAWTDTLGWLREFRQGEGRWLPGARTAPSKKMDGAVSAVAREPRPGRPGLSYWPEADKIRRLYVPPKEPWTHSPRPQYTSTAAWPRAGFGLPLAIRFQREGRPIRQGERGARYHEPPDVMLKWKDAKGGEHDRLASPLIVKAMPLADGSFVPIALWLRRAWPEGGRVVLTGDRRGLLPGADTSAPFEPLLAPDDTALYAPLVRQSNLEDAFLDWVKGFRGVKESL